MKAVLKCALIPFDALAIVALAAAVAIGITGGGVFVVAGHVVSARSVGNVILFLSLWAVVRYRLRDAPLLLIPSLPLVNAPQAALRVAHASSAWLSRVDARRTAALVGGVACAITLVKLALVVRHVGFFSGDDIEIHEMTMNALFGTSWPIWELRSAFFPMVFIYPLQWLALTARVSDTAHLVMVAWPRPLVNLVAGREGGSGFLVERALSMRIRRDVGHANVVEERG